MTLADSPLRRLLDRLSGARNVLVTTHVRPDGDALGSAAALQLGLTAKGIASHVLLLSRLPDKYAFVFERAGVEFTAAAEDGTLPPREWFERHDAVLVVDTGTWSQLPGLEPILPALPAAKLIVDHHQTQQGWADVLWQDTTAAAAGEMVEELLKAWGVPLTAEMAHALFVAIVSDTGWLQYSNTTPRTLRLVADLVAAGVDTDAVYQRLYQNEKQQRLLLMQRAMASLRFEQGGRVAVMLIGPDDFAASGADVPDTESLVNVPLQVREVQVSVVLTQPPGGGPIRASLRSKGAVDVAKFAEQFGGGGHARAAGAKFAGLTLEAARDLVLAALATAAPAPTAAGRLA